MHNIVNDHVVVYSDGVDDGGLTLVVGQVVEAFRTKRQGGFGLIWTAIRRFEA